MFGLCVRLYVCGMCGVCDVCVYVWCCVVCMCLSVFEGQKLTSGVFLYHSDDVILRQGFLLNIELTDWLYELVTNWEHHQCLPIPQC